MLLLSYNHCRDIVFREREAIIVVVGASSVASPLLLLFGP